MKQLLSALTILIALTSTLFASEITQNYHPLRKGLKWEESYTTLGYTQVSATINTRITGKETINGKEYWKVVSVPSGMPGSEPTTNYLRKAKDGIHVIYDSDPKKQDVLDFPLPIKIGKTWEISFPKGHAQNTITSIETVELPNRSYKDCIKMTSVGTYDSEQFESTIYFAPNIGSIKMVRYWPDADFTEEIILKKFRKF